MLFFQLLVQKVKFSPSAGRRSRNVVPDILNRGIRWRWVVNLKLQPLYVQERTPVSTEQDAGWATDRLCRKVSCP
jgi:hypothetical protein